MNDYMICCDKNGIIEDVECPSCGGTGNQVGHDGEFKQGDCAYCSGTGKITVKIYGVDIWGDEIDITNHIRKGKIS